MLFSSDELPLLTEVFHGHGRERTEDANSLHDRRRFLWQSGRSGQIASPSLQGDGIGGSAQESRGLHHEAPGRRVVQLFMSGMPARWTRLTISRS